MSDSNKVLFYLIALEPLLFLALAFFIYYTVPMELFNIYVDSLKALVFFIASVADALFVLVLSKVFYGKSITSADEYKEIPKKAFLLISLNTLVISLGMVSFFLSLNWVYLIASIALFYLIYYLLYRKLTEFEKNFESFIIVATPKKEEPRIELKV
ncbi:MAG: hypothetical protein ABH803_00385 [Candidatus Micrarchaeota archaeon]